MIESSLIEPEVFAVIFERHAESVLRYLTARVGTSSAEDLVGETFSTAFRCRSSFDLSRPDARPWLFGIATNIVRHHWRSRARRAWGDPFISRSEPPEPDVSDQAINTVLFQSQKRDIAGALAQLDDGFTDVLLLVAGPGFTYAEVAEALNIPVGTVRSRMARARDQLRELLWDQRQYLDEDLSREEERS